METELDQQLAVLDERLAVVQQAVERTRRYMLWSLILQLAVVLLPLVVLMFAAPFILSSLSNLSDLYQGL